MSWLASGCTALNSGSANCLCPAKLRWRENQHRLSSHQMAWGSIGPFRRLGFLCKLASFVSALASMNASAALMSLCWMNQECLHLVGLGGAYLELWLQGLMLLTNDRELGSGQSQRLSRGPCVQQLMEECSMQLKLQRRVCRQELRILGLNAVYGLKRNTHHSINNSAHSSALRRFLPLFLSQTSSATQCKSRFPDATHACDCKL